MREKLDTIVPNVAANPLRDLLPPKQHITGSVTEGQLQEFFIQQYFNTK